MATDKGQPQVPAEAVSGSAKFVVVTGGSRSGKSDYAQSLAETFPVALCYLATCPSPQGEDPEMTARVRAHQLKRKGRDWQTWEEPLELTRLLREIPGEATVLIDCLTLWISNLLYADPAGDFDEAMVSRLAEEIVTAAKARAGRVILVTSEVGCGLVPEHALARRYRDLMGRCNQVVAAGADRVVLVVSGIPVIIKG